MCRLCIEKLDPAKAAPADLAGLRTTVTIPDVPRDVTSWQDFLNWLQEHPEIIAALISAILMLLGGIAPPQKR